MWREEISRDAVENSNGANGFLARGPYRAITRWHVLTIFQPLNPRAPSSPSLLPLLALQKQTYWCWGSRAALPRRSAWLSPSLKSLFSLSLSISRCSCCNNISKREQGPKSSDYLHFKNLHRWNEGKDMKKWESYKGIEEHWYMKEYKAITQNQSRNKLFIQNWIIFFCEHGATLTVNLLIHPK